MKKLLFLLLFTSSATLAQPYFQQEVNYNIKVRLDDKKHELHAFESVEYINKSPHELAFIYFHLWPNAYKNNSSANAKQFIRNGSDSFYFAEDSLKGSIDSLQFMVDGQTLIWEFDPIHIDICKVNLPNPLKPGEKITITTPFRVKIPGEFSRLGHVGQGYQITQWYPKPAVFDNKGWHAMPYLDQGEFFSEFGSFEVEISVPQNYKVAATGQLQEESEKQWLMEQVAATQKLEELPNSNDFPISSVQYKTLTFKQDQIHDFAWFADKRYLVNKSQVDLPSGKQVDSWVFFLPGKSAQRWNKGAMYIDSALYYYSKWVGEYPYPAATAVQGALLAGGGMEYPMITVISAGGSDFALDQVITHEVGHNWFYGILASNERKYAWMDEGFNSFIENRYMNARYPDATFATMIGDSKVVKTFGFDKIPYPHLQYISASLLSSYGKQQIINTPSDQLNSSNYGLMSYYRTSALLFYLKDYLGETVFDQCMHTYFDRWKFKHPYPEDLQKIFEEVSGKKLDWFFGNLFNTLEQIDYKIASAKKEGNNYLVNVKNTGSAIVPYKIDLLKDDKIVATHWFEGHSEAKTQELAYLEVDKLVINHDYSIPELNMENNSYKTHGLLKKVEPLKIDFLTSISNNETTNIHVIPLVGTNTFDQFLLGASVHNLNIQGGKFNYYLAPMYSFGGQSLAGNFILKYDWLPSAGVFKKVRLMGQYKKFSIMAKTQASITTFFGSHWNQHVQLSLSDIIKRSVDPLIHTSYYQLISLHYNSHQKNALRDQQLKADFNYALGQADFQSFELQYYYDRKLSKKLTLASKWFAGVLLGGNPSPDFWLYTGSSPDYAMSYYRLDRADISHAGSFGQSMVLNDQGGFKIANIAAQDWMGTGSLELVRKGKIIGAFADAGLADGSFYYDAGISLKFGPAKVYVPATSNIYTNLLPDSFDQFSRSIRFSVSANIEQFWNSLDKLLN